MLSATGIGIVTAWGVPTITVCARADGLFQSKYWQLHVAALIVVTIGSYLETDQELSVLLMYSVTCFEVSLSINVKSLVVSSVNLHVPETSYVITAHADGAVS